MAPYLIKMHAPEEEKQFAKKEEPKIWEVPKGRLEDLLHQPPVKKAASKPENPVNYKQNKDQLLKWDDYVPQDKKVEIIEPPSEMEPLEKDLKNISIEPKKSDPVRVNRLAMPKATSSVISARSNSRGKLAPAKPSPAKP